MVSMASSYSIPMFLEGLYAGSAMFTNLILPLPLSCGQLGRTSRGPRGTRSLGYPLASSLSTSNICLSP